ncbi:MAG: O-methyltransferase, partial [Planctomycetota bacterium]
MKVAYGALVLVLVVAAAALMAQRRGGRGSLGNQPLAKNAAEKRILDVAERVPRRMNVPLEDGRMIRILTEAIGAKKAVEIGTSTGYSGLWFAMALRNTGGKLTTFEIEPDVAETARRIFREAGVDDIVTVVVGDAHEKIRELEGPIDIVFIDAEKPGYRDYFDQILPLVRPGGLILAHNIFQPSDNPRYAEAVTTNPELETT